MEFTPVPHPAPTIGRGRVLAALLVLGPVVVLVFLPTVLGLHRYVVADRSMEGNADGSISRGSVALTRVVPAADLEIGDVIVFGPPGEDTREGESGPVARRVVAIQDGVALTRGDDEPANDPWQLDVSTGTYPRVAFVVPWIGHPFSGQAGQGGWLLLVAMTAIAMLLSAVMPLRRARERHRRSPPTPYAGMR